MSYETKACRKLMSTRQYICWESFTPTKRKTSLISVLAHRALMIYSKNKLKEIHQIKEILSDNGYPEDIISKRISNKISQFSNPKTFGPDKCTVYLRSPFIGSASKFSGRSVKTAVENCCGSIVTRVVHVTKPMLLPTAKYFY